MTVKKVLCTLVLMVSSACAHVNSERSTDLNCSYNKYSMSCSRIFLDGGKSQSVKYTKQMLGGIKVCTIETFIPGEVIFGHSGASSWRTEDTYMKLTDIECNGTVETYEGNKLEQVGLYYNHPGIGTVNLHKVYNLSRNQYPDFFKDHLDYMFMDYVDMLKLELIDQWNNKGQSK